MQPNEWGEKTTRQRKCGKSPPRIFRLNRGPILSRRSPTCLDQGEYERSTACYQESLTLRQETGEKEGIATALEGLAAVTGMQGQPVRAARLSGAASSLRTLLGAPLTPIDRLSYQQTPRFLLAIRVHLGNSA